MDKESMALAIAAASLLLQLIDILRKRRKD